jgi:putative ABC transport system permease protein
MVPISYNVRSLFVRKVTTIATAFGVGMVVFVLAATLMLGAGIEKALGTAGKAENVIILRNGSDAELSSGVQNDAMALIRERPEVAKLPNGNSAVIGEIVIVVTAELADGSGGISNVLIRGSEPDGLLFRPEIKITTGRAPKPGTNEVIIGEAISGRFKGMSPGKSFDLRRNRPFNVVGAFTAGGSSYESEVLGDLEVIRTSLGRQQTVSSARLRLTDPSKFDSFRASIEADKRLGMKVMRETAYYTKQAEGTSQFLSGMGIAMSFLLSLAAMIGAAITMNGAIANRTKEIGTLRALGFSKLAILTSFLFEAMFLALLGGAAGTALVMLMTLVTFPVMNFATFSEIVIRFTATPGIVVGSLVFSVVMGLIGGLLPAIRAARISPVEAMRGG